MEEAARGWLSSMGLSRDWCEWGEEAEGGKGGEGRECTAVQPCSSKACRLELASSSSPRQPRCPLAHACISAVR